MGDAVMKKRILERHVDRQICDYMAYKGWRSVRMNRGIFQGPSQVLSIGEPGMADRVFYRYLRHECSLIGAALVLWVEMKSNTDRRACRCVLGDSKLCGFCLQVRWQDRERARGAEVWQVSSFEEFDCMYSKTFGWLHTGTVKGQIDLLLAATQ
jgi:hypothetical protein